MKMRISLPRNRYMRSTVLLAFLLMVFGAVASLAMTPRVRMADKRNYDLEKIIPKSFAGWHEETIDSIILPDPGANSLVDKIYNKVLARSYKNTVGDEVMLVIAYGGDQSDALQLHRPEVCYAANGYKVSPVRFMRRVLSGRPVMLARMEAEQHYWHESVTYWMRVGARQVATNVDRQWVKFVAGLNGVIPDGVLFRVSSRSSDGASAAAGALHDRFISDLLSSLNSAAVELLVGRGAPAATAAGT